MSRLLEWRTLSMLMAVAGVLVAGYLTVSHYQGTDSLICTVGNCKAVQDSPYAKIGGIPISVFGLGMYLTVIGLGIVRWLRIDLNSLATAGAFSLALAGSIYAAYLTYLEVAVINAICQWCVISAVLTLGILVVESIGVNRVLGEVPS